jgi:alcohol dehydrogenase class IV
VLDPLLTVGLPPKITAATGMDALTHAVEAYIGRSNTPATEAAAKEAVRLIFQNLEKAYQDGNDIAAREGMLMGSYQAGLAFTRAYVGYVHAIAHAVGGLYGVAHGLANAIILPYVLEAYGKSAEVRLAQLAVTAGAAASADDAHTAAGKLIAAIRGMNERMGIPAHVKEIQAGDIPEIARRADKEANPLYPVPRIMDQPELAALVRRIAGIQ